MIHAVTKELLVTAAIHGSDAVEAEMPMKDIANSVMAGTVAIIKRAFEPGDMRRLRGAINAEKLPICPPTFGHDAHSWRDRRETWVNPDTKVLYEASFMAVANPDDKLGRLMRTTVERLAALWRSLTGHEHGLQAQSGRRALRPWAMYYPAGGGCFGWHEHGLEPTRIGLILAMSQIGVDFERGGTEFRTPHGVVNVESSHDIGDVCMFRYDLPHRVTSVDPQRELTWDGTGRWTLLIQGDPRPVDTAAA
jgi:hypothetical protein